MADFQERMKALRRLVEMVDKGLRSSSRAAFSTKEEFTWYCVGLMPPKHSRIDLMFLYQDKSSRICSVRAALRKLEDGSSIALLRYFIQRLMQLKKSGIVPVSPHAAALADLPLIPRMYLR